jgi:predicted nucleic acid-binding protein
VKAVLDACVLYPTVLRQVLLGVARDGLFQPLWSDRILEEWARAAARLGAVAELRARGEIALAKAAFPGAMVQPGAAVLARLVLPDPGDVHVLAAAISGGAEAIVTFNAADFPRHVLAEDGIARRDPDGLLWELWSADPAPVARVAEAVRAETERLSGRPTPLRGLMKKVGLPRLGKALTGG